MVSPDPINVLSGWQPATSIYADGRSSDDVIAFCRYFQLQLEVSSRGGIDDPTMVDL